MVAVRRSSVLALLALASLPVRGQDPYTLNRYEQRYGTPVEVALYELIQNGSSYEGRAIKTKGDLELESSQNGRQYSLRDTFCGHVLLVPVKEIGGSWDSEALRMGGKEIEVTGVFSANRPTGSTASG